MSGTKADLLSRRRLMARMVMGASLAYAAPSLAGFDIARASEVSRGGSAGESRGDTSAGNSGGASNGASRGASRSVSRGQNSAPSREDQIRR